MKKIIVFILLSLFTLSLFAQITFNRTYNSLVDGTNSVIVLDSGYYFAMNVGQPVLPTQVCFVKTNLYGDTVFQKHYGKPNDFYTFSSLLKTDDSNFISGSLTTDFLTGIARINIFKVNDNGDTLWTYSHYPPIDSSYIGAYCTISSDKGITVTGQIIEQNQSDASVLLFKTDSLGNKLWESQRGGALFDAGVSSVETSDKGYLTLGWTRSFGFGSNTNRDMYLIKWDSVGNYQWQKTFGTPAFDSGLGITKTKDSSYLLAGGKGVSTTVVKGWVIKIDEMGTVLWQYIDSALISELYWARERFDGTIVCVGSKAHPVNGKDQGWIVKLDSAGNLLWQRTFQLNNDHSYFRDVQFTADSGYIASGFVFEGPDSSQDAWLVKLDSLGCDSVGCATYVGIEENTFYSSSKFIRISPNPAMRYIDIFPIVPIYNFATWTILDMAGKVVLGGSFYIKEIQRIFIEKLTVGMYIINFNFEGQSITEKFIKE